MNVLKKNKVLPGITVIALCGLMSMAYQNCARAKFSIDPAAKSEALGKESVFERDGGDDGNIVGGDVPGDDGSVPGKNPGGNDPSVPTMPTPGKSPSGGNDPSVPTMPTPKATPKASPTPVKNPSGDDSSTPTTGSVPVNFEFLCSNMKSDQAGGNVLSLAALKVAILTSESKVACELTGDFKSEILNTKKLNITPCANLAPGTYQAVILDASTQLSSKADLSSMMTVMQKSLSSQNIKFTKNANGTFTGPSSKIKIVYDFNKQDSDFNKVIAKYGNTTTTESQARCDERVSPLIVSMNSEARGIQLTSPLEGIQFDILGENSFPRAHDKKQISWLTKEDQEYYFIVLPNKQGQVLGINEMFGDNTRGPDGKFAANGYDALAKYDDDKDHLITDEDAIYSELRLWSDRNRDGVADPNELYTLKEKSIIVVDLNYDKGYKETDKYGNQTLMKSVVKTEDGKLHLMFDLWFRYLNITK